MGPRVGVNTHPKSSAIDFPISSRADNSNGLLSSENQLRTRSLLLSANALVLYLLSLYTSPVVLSLPLSSFISFLLVLLVLSRLFSYS